MSRNRTIQRSPAHESEPEVEEPEEPEKPEPKKAEPEKKAHGWRALSESVKSMKKTAHEEPAKGRKAGNPVS